MASIVAPSDNKCYYAIILNPLNLHETYKNWHIEITNASTLE